MGEYNRFFDFKDESVKGPKVNRPTGNKKAVSLSPEEEKKLQELEQELAPIVVERDNPRPGLKLEYVIEMDRKRQEAEIIVEEAKRFKEQRDARSEGTSAKAKPPLMDEAIKQYDMLNALNNTLPPEKNAVTSKSIWKKTQAFLIMH